MRKFGGREKVAEDTEMKKGSDAGKSVDEGGWEGEDADGVGLESSVREFPIPSVSSSAPANSLASLQFRLPLRLTIPPLPLVSPPSLLPRPNHSSLLLHPIHLPPRSLPFHSSRPACPF